MHPLYKKHHRLLRYHVRMDNFEQKWELIRQQLRIQATGDKPPVISSGRTLFGIKSDVEKQMDAIVNEIEEKNRQERLRKREKTDKEKNQ